MNESHTNAHFRLIREVSMQTLAVAISKVLAFGVGIECNIKNRGRACTHFFHAGNDKDENSKIVGLMVEIPILKVAQNTNFSPADISLRGRDFHLLAIYPFFERAINVFDA